MVVDVAPLLIRTDLTTAKAKATSRQLVVHEPHSFVEAVDVLFDDMVSRQPGEIQPVANLVFHFGPLWLATAMPQCAGQIIGVNRDDVTDRSIHDALDRFAYA